jgi:tetratricopeptide (TPR) repeat protein
MRAKMNDDRAPQDHRTAPALSRVRTALAAAVLVAAGIAAYWNSFAGQFVFDDGASICQNPSLTDLRDLGRVLRPPADLSTAGRPLVNLTLAVNYALGDTTDLWSYHAFNLTVHLAAALALMGVLRRTLLSPPLRDRFGRSALALATAVALLWMLHPLQVQAVTYITQRAESMVSLAYLLTLYCTIRSAASRGARAAWSVAAVLVCAAGMATKEVMVTAPVAVLVYDRLFLAGGWRKALAQRWPLYAGLAATWAILAALMGPGPRSASAGLGLAGITPLRYAATQCAVVLYYLRLTFWPSPLAADYAWPWAGSFAQVWPAAAAVGAMVAGTIVLLWRGQPLAMAGVWFFLILAPTSSIVPILDPIFEHRMYLPLAAPLAVAVLAGDRVLAALSRTTVPGVKRSTSLGALATAVIAAWAAALGWLAHERNTVYSSEQRYWQDVVDKQPNSWRGHNNLGTVFLGAGELERAIEHFQIAQKLTDQSRKDHYFASYNLAHALLLEGRYDQSQRLLEELLADDPHNADVLTLQGNLALARDNPVEAADAYTQALKAAPHNDRARVGLANALLAQGKTAAAKATLDQSPTVPSDPQTALLLAKTQSRLGDTRAAIAILRRVLDRRPTAHYVPALVMLGALYNKTAEFPKAVEILTRAAALATGPADQNAANRELGLAYAQTRQFPQAERAYLAALEADANDPAALNNLADLYVNDLDQPDKALPYATRAAELAPDNGSVLDTLGWALARTGSYDQAQQRLTAALRRVTHPASLAHVHYHLGWVQEQTLRRAEAAKQYRQGLEALKGQTDDPVYALLSEALERVQKPPTPK